MVSLWELMTIATEAKKVASDPNVITVAASTSGTYVHLGDDAFDAFFPFAVDEEPYSTDTGEQYNIRSISLDGIKFINYRRKPNAESV